MKGLVRYQSVLDAYIEIVGQPTADWVHEIYLRRLSGVFHDSWHFSDEDLTNVCQLLLRLPEADAILAKMEQDGETRLLERIRSRLRELRKSDK